MMKHFIIVKFNEDFNFKEFLDDIKDVFKDSLSIDGVEEVNFHISNTDISNRHDLMIEMILSHDGLINFDNSNIHKNWKERFGEFISTKTIFDYDI